MAETTLTRQTLRRAIGKELSMPFFRRFQAGEGTIDGSSTASKIIDAMLTQSSGFWNGSWFYGLTAGDLSLIRAFEPGGHSFQLEVPMAAAPSAGDKYEIHTLWNAVDMHNAIDRAVSLASRAFPESVVDQTFVYCEDKMEYDLTTLAKKPFILNHVYAEKPSILIRGQAAGGAVGYLDISEGATVLSGVGNGYLISIYAGTGMNQVRTVSTVSGVRVTPTVAWTTAPDNTSKYAIWNPDKQRYDWERIDFYYNDSVEFPDRMSLRTRLPYYYGMRMRMEYLFANETLATDAATTIIPREFLVEQAVALLHGQKLNDTKSDRELHFAEFTRHNDAAQKFLVANAPRKPGITLQSSGAPTYMDIDDPLGWFPGQGR